MEAAVRTIEWNVRYPLETGRAARAAGDAVPALAPVVLVIGQHEV